MKRFIVLLVLILILSTNTIGLAAATPKFADVKNSDWYSDAVSLLVNLGAISGYPDGCFRPNNAITKAEFIKTLISSLGYNVTEKNNSHWASGYILKAEELKIIEKNWLQDIDKPISRYEMVRIISNTLTFRKENVPANTEEYKALIKDFNKIPNTQAGETNGKLLKSCVLETYAKGIVTGYPNGNFEGEDTLTRAEASTVIVRILNNNYRVKNELPSSSDFDEEVLKLVNIEREKKGLKALTLSDDLSEVALLKSKDMAANNYFDHISPTYGAPFEMMSKMGIKYRAAGENIALGYTTPSSVVKAWMESPGHRENILNPLYRKMGLGYFKDGTTYWTQMFTD